MIKYPDIVSAPLRLTSINYPKPVTSKIDGRLTKLLVTNKEKVTQGEVIAFLESTADHEQILAISRSLKAIEKKKSDFSRSNELQSLVGENKMALGELQSAFRTFASAYNKFATFQENGFYISKKNLLQDEINNLLALQDILKDQKSIHEKTLRIAENEFSVSTTLATQKVIAPLELAREEGKLLDKQIPSKQIETNIINNDLLIVQRKRELLEVEGLIKESSSYFTQELHTFKSEVDSWCAKYLLTAPVPGVVFYAGLIEEQQYVRANQDIFYVGVDNPEVFGELSFQQLNFGKIKLDQQVIIKLHSYPYSEFGVVEGKVSFISEIASRDSTYLARVNLTNGLITSHGKALAFKNGLSAKAEIIIEDLTLLQRILFFFGSMDNYQTR